MIICHWFVIEFWRYIAAPDVPDGVSPTHLDAVAGAHVNAGCVLPLYTAMPERRDVPVLRRVTSVVRAPDIVSAAVAAPDGPKCGRSVARCTHNPEVAGSSPAPATRKCRSGA